MQDGILDFSDTPITEGGAFAPNGVFPGLIQSAQMTVAGTGNPQIEFKVALTEPGLEGIVRTGWVGLTSRDPKKLKQVWGACFLSIGVTPAEMATLKVQFSQLPTVFTGRACLIKLSDARKQNGSIVQDLSFLKPKQYEISRKTQDALGGLDVLIERHEAARAEREAASVGGSGLPAGLTGGAAPTNGLPAGLVTGGAAPTNGLPAGLTGGTSAAVAAPAAVPAAAPAMGGGLAALLGQ